MKMQIGEVSRIALVLGSAFALWLALSSASEAAVEGGACAAEPTDQLIHYGDLINCAIGQVGDDDVFRFSGGSGETVKIQLIKRGGGIPCFQLFDPDGKSLDFTRCSNTSQNYTLSQSGTYTIVILESGLTRPPNTHWPWTGSSRHRRPPCRSTTTT